MWKWFMGQDILVKGVLALVAGMVAYGLFTMVGGVWKHNTNVAVEQAAEAGAAKAVAEGTKGVLDNVAKAQAAEAEFMRLQALNAGRSCPAYNECVQSNRDGSSACQRFLPYRQTGEPVDCADAWP